MLIHNDKKRNGSALILVVIVTVLLSIIGIIFVMTMRIREMTSSNVADDRDLDTAVEAVTEKIGTVLRQDLFGTALGSSIINGTGGGNEPYDSLDKDTWLASLEPSKYLPAVKNLAVNTDSDPTNDWYQWDQLTNLYGTASKWDKILRDGQPGWNLASKQFGGIVEDYQEFYRTLSLTAEYVLQNPNVVEGLPADADGDGVADSLWERLPNISTSRGKPVFTAVRIIDNCAMLNLNTANCFYEDKYAANNSSMFIKWWQYYNTVSGSLYTYLDSNLVRQYYNDGGRYLSEINYLPFLRGRDTNGIWGSTGDGWYYILVAKKFGTVNGVGDPTSQLTTSQVHQILMNIENPANIIYSGDSYNLFDVGDELEIRNRCILTSLVESRFERSDIGNFTFDAGGSSYVSLQIPRDSTIDSDNIPNFTKWKWRIDPNNFDAWSGAFVGTWNSQSLDNRYKYDRRHVCTFYSYDRNIRTGDYDWLSKEALDLLPETNPTEIAQKRTVEYVFRPLDHQPIDLRKMTDVTYGGNIITPDFVNTDPDTNYSYRVTTYRNILHLLYAFREHFYDEILKWGTTPVAQAKGMAARQAAQYVANIIDNLDPIGASTAATGPFQDAFVGSQKDNNPTFINQSIVVNMITYIDFFDPSIPPGFFATATDIKNKGFDFGLDPNDVVYGYECQPFISEVYAQVNDSGVVGRFAIEILNPYNMNISISGWKLVLEGLVGNAIETFTFPNGTVISAGTAMSPGRLVLRSSTSIPSTGTIIDNSFGLNIKSAHRLCLKRSTPSSGGTTVFINIDQIPKAQINLITSDVPDGNFTHHVLSRDDTAWKFTNMDAYVDQQWIDPLGNNYTATLTLGASNAVTSPKKGYQLPMDNAQGSLDRLADFQKIIFVGNEPNVITDVIAQAAAVGEKKVRFDPVTDIDSAPYGLSQYVCTLGRGQKGIPGRININTAPLHVIAAAIPPQLVMTSATDPNDALFISMQIVANRPYKNMRDLLKKIPAIKKYAVDTNIDAGEQGIRDDFEERDWIFNRLSNIFTVRSDTFTAYILVRTGTDGPQRRMLAIFDRSNCWTATDRPRLVALHLVPDPR